jgi:hypothetical protein
LGRKIFLLPSIHCSGSFKNKVEKVVIREKIQCCLAEAGGTEGYFSIKNFLRYPFFFIVLRVYFTILRTLPTSYSDFQTLEKICQKNNIPIYKLNKKIEDTIGNNMGILLNWTPLILWIILSYTFSLSIGLFFSIPLSFIIIEVLTLAFFALKSMDSRETDWVERIEKILREEEYERIILMFGKGHLDSMKHRMSKVGNLEVIKYK